MKKWELCAPVMCQSLNQAVKQAKGIWTVLCHTQN